MNDYFSSSGSSTPAEPQQPLGKSKLPTFNRMDNLDRLQTEPTSLSGAKIFNRRMKQAEDAAASSTDDIAHSHNNSLSERFDDDHDEEAAAEYQRKLDEMKEKKNAEFYNTEESDVDINSDEDLPPPEERTLEKPEVTQQEGSSSSSGDDKHSIQKQESHSVQNDVSSSIEDEDKQPGGFRRFLRRMNVGDSHPSTEYPRPPADDQSLNSHDSQPKRNFFQRLALGEEDDLPDDPQDGFFERFVNFGGGGLAPGASKSNPKKEDDEEAQLGADGVEMKELEPEDYAKNIINAHSKPVRSDNSDQTTLANSEMTNDSSFLADNPEYYLRDDDDIYELQLDGNNSYVAPPERVRGGVLSSLLRLYQNPAEASRSRLQLSGSEGTSPINSGSVTPAHGGHREPLDPKSLSDRLKNFAGKKKKVQIDDSNVGEQKGHVRASSHTDLSMLSPDYFKRSKRGGSTQNLPTFKTHQQPGVPGKAPIAKLLKGPAGKIKTKREQAKAKITIHIAEFLQRQRFVLRMCKALMLYGAPTHRLEEYLTMTARVLEIDAQFIYLPGCMIISFGDPTTRTSEVQLVRCAQGLDLYKLHRVHKIYKKVIHDIVGVEEASTSLDELLSQKPTFAPWACVLIYAFSSSMVTPFAFGGGWVNLPVSFGIGLCVGGLQYLLAPRSNLYSNVFEVTASIVVSFIGRALGSLSGSGICFSAVVQGSLALILPGYIILCGSLELQSRNLVAGSVRMFYAIIYSLFLGFGITLGAAIYGWIDHGATSETTCSEQISPWFRFLFVPMFTIGLGLINQARLFQLPVMLFISCAGYVVSYFAGLHFSNSTEFTAAISSFVIGVLGNLYSRLYKGIAVSAMLPAIFVQVPSAIASKSSLLAGVASANQIVSNTTTTSSTDSSGISFGVTMIQVAIGISVGLFASTIAVYPMGKRSTSVFTL